MDKSCGTAKYSLPWNDFTGSVNFVLNIIKRLLNPFTVLE